MRSPINISNNSSQSGRIRLIVLFGILFIFLATIGITFLVSIYQSPSTHLSGPNLVQNPSLEKWEDGSLKGWSNTGVFAYKKTSDVVAGQFAAGILNKNTSPRGLYQTIDLNPEKVYNVYFCLKGERYQKKDVGVKINYEGESVRATQEISPGAHYYDADNQWRQYFGRVQGAQSISLRFFSRNNSMLLIDGVGVGVNHLPENYRNDTLLSAAGEE